MRPVLEPISSAILHIGPLGTASSLKLAMNMHIAGIGQILCESLALCRASGIPDEVYFEALGRNAAHIHDQGNYVLECPQILAKRFRTFSDNSTS